MVPRVHGRRSAAGFVVLLVTLIVAGQVIAQQVPKSAGARTSRSIVQLAQSELKRGVRELPDGSNRAPAIRRYETATAGAAYGAPWCAYFVSYIAKRAGVPIGPGGRGLGYVPYIRAWAHQTGRWTSRPRPGELVTFAQHVGIVETVYANHTMTTIEGNHGNAVSRVFRRWSEAMGYVRLAGGDFKPLAPGTRPTLPQPPVRKLPPLKARITLYPGTAIAAGQTIQFSSDDSSGRVKRSDWDLTGDGKFDARGDNVQRKYEKPGTFTVTLRVRGGGKRTATVRQKILVRPNVAPVAGFTVSSANLLVDDTIVADASQSHDPDGQIVKYEWDLDGNGDWGEDGAMHDFTYEVAGDYHAGLRVTDNDGNVTEVHVGVHVAELPGPQSKIVCESTTVGVGSPLRCKADDSSSPVRVVRHEWDLDDDGNTDSRGSGVRWVYRKPGTYTVHLTVKDSRGQVQENTQDVVVTNKPPVAKVTGPSRLAVGESAQYDATRSTDQDGRITGFAWTVEDKAGTRPITGTGRLRFTPTAPGVYTLAVTVLDDSRDSSRATVTVTVVGQPPVARVALPADPLVAGRASDLDASGSTSPYGEIATYEWDLDGDGTFETTGATPAFTPVRSGPAKLRMRVTDAYGATTTMRVSVLVHAAPQAALTAPATATVGKAVVFSSAGSSDADGRIVTYTWDFDGDGVIDRTTTTRGSTSWSFAGAGSFLVTLTAIDDEGLKTSATATVVVSPVVTAAPATAPG